MYASELKVIVKGSGFPQWKIAESMGVSEATIYRKLRGDAEISPEFENDLMEAGIADTPERAREILGYTTAVVHYKPKDNQRDILMKAAKKFSKSKFAVATRYVKWMR